MPYGSPGQHSQWLLLLVTVLQKHVGRQVQEPLVWGKRDIMEISYKYFNASGGRHNIKAISGLFLQEIPFTVTVNVFTS